MHKSKPMTRLEGDAEQFCPCGGNPQTRVRGGRDRLRFLVYCDGCQACTRLYATKVGAVAAWERRDVPLAYDPPYSP